ncbi:hypothetical protein [Clostridium paraputrificum]|uniref:hypothetical protein n=1 Tax=Clostridium paraputrificum TaxID=29363 RepID=UPI00374FAFC9
MYCEKSNLTLQEYKDYLVTLRCKCGEPDCCGWVAVCDNTLSINNHNKLYYK